MKLNMPLFGNQGTRVWRKSGAQWEVPIVCDDLGGQISAPVG